MTTQKKQFQRHCREYMRQHGVERIDPTAVAEWMIDTGRWEPRKSALVRQCSNHIKDALRAQTFTDPQGRKVRAMHPVVEERDGKQMSFWGDMREMSRTHMALSFQQRRRQIVGDCGKLKTDVDSYNDNFNKGNFVQLSLDFTSDVLEDQLGQSPQATPATKPARSSSKLPLKRPSVIAPAPSHL